jgi:CheY-like chemotaxis protein
MSHEIRAPLNNILGFSEQLKTSPGEHPEKYLDGIITSAELMLSTVNQILDLSKLEAGKMTYNRDIFSPYKAIEKAGGIMVLRAREKKLMLNLHLPTKEDILVEGDSFHLTQVMINLIDNAIKYTDKGEVNVSAHVKPEASGYKAYIEVADTGMGIPSDKVDEIFNEFERLDENDKRRWKPGTGLGLPIAQKVIEQQGGRIYVKTTSSKGTVFAIELPYSTPDHKMAAPPVTYAQPKLLSGKTLLLADDDNLSILLIMAMFKNHDITIISAKNGQEALEIVLNSKIDLILTDINMPILSGADFIRQLRAKPTVANIPVIAVTANVMANDVKKIEKDGFNSIIFKPFKQNELIEKVSSFLK